MLFGTNFVKMGGGMFSYGYTEYHICPYRESVWYLKDKEGLGKVGVLVAKYRTCHIFKYAQIYSFISITQKHVQLYISPLSLHFFKIWKYTTLFAISPL
jgi:hypothetical protein